MSEKKRYDTWTYASANSVTVPGDLSGTYWPGMRVALKQGTVKHFLIEEVVYNGTTQTTITLNGMGVYTLTSDPITAHIDTVEAYPKGFPFAVSTETVPGLCPALTGDETKFLRSDGSWEVPGDVSGPSSSVDGNIAAFDGTDGKKIKDALYPVSMFADGWIPAGETWTYASADDPTYTFTISGDKTGKYGVGMRIKLTQTSAKYFIITKVEYSSPNTTVTVYGGTDYDLADATISSPYYSREKAPLGFPLDPTKWTVEYIDSVDRTKTSAADTTWYNLNSASLSVPIGVWKLEYYVIARGTVANAQQLGVKSALSTSSSETSDTTLAAMTVTSGADVDVGSNHTRSKTISLASKTTYYLLTCADIGYGTCTLENSGGNGSTIIRAVCAYL